MEKGKGNFTISLNLQVLSGDFYNGRGAESVFYPIGSVLIFKKIIKMFEIKKDHKRSGM
jgi:hypothetical protein